MNSEATQFPNNDNNEQIEAYSSENLIQQINPPASTLQNETLNNIPSRKLRKLPVILAISGVLITLATTGILGYFKIKGTSNNPEVVSSANENNNVNTKSEDKIKVSWNIVKISDTAETAFVVAENTTQDYVKNLKIDIKSSGGDLFESGFQPTVIPPGGKSVYAVSVNSLNDKITAKVSGDFVKEGYSSKLKVSNPVFNPSTQEFSAKLSNVSESIIHFPSVALILYGNDKKVQSVIMPNEFPLSIKPGASIDLNYTPVLPVGFVYSSHEYVAYGEVR